MSNNPIVITRSEHIISRANISRNAVKVLYRLKNAGYEAYLVGGGVRDLLLGREPKDFDVATNALPEEVKDVFTNCRLIGRRFRLAHVHFGREIIEVATFRSLAKNDTDGDRKVENGRILRDNIYGSIEEDAQRRDFTINALYYSIEDFSVVDYADGMSDLRNGVLRLLGDPEQRYREDPVRMLRAVRFAGKLGFIIDPVCEKPLPEMAHLLQEVPASRLFEEVLKLFMGGAALETFEKLRHYELFGQLFPATEEALSHEDHEFPITFVNRGLQNTDSRLQARKPVTPAFMFGVLLWEAVRRRAETYEADGIYPSQALQDAGNEILSEQAQRISIPKRFSYPMRDIWYMQPRFLNRNGKRPHRLLTHPRFRAAYDFLLLRAESGEVEQELADWWANFLKEQGQGQTKSSDQDGSRGRTNRRRRRRKPKKTTPSGNE
ncbi:MAG: polynucleotide adenylyltransferase PcnB [Pseudomonadota bacterium]